MLALIYFGKTFGMSSNLRTMCTMLGADKAADFFNFDWKAQRWNLVVILGAAIGGWIAVTYLSDGSGVQINPQTVAELRHMNVDEPNGKLLPDALTSAEALQSPKVLAILLIGGVLVGFGTRYAGGCTSGHAITGLSNLQLPSLIAVIGFFAGGLLMSWLLLPLILN